MKINYNKTPVINIGRTDTTMSAEAIHDTLRDIADLMGENKPNAADLKSIYHLREHDGTHIVHVRRKDDSVSVFRFAPN